MAQLTTGVHHIALKCKGIPAFEKTMHFYTQILGMPIVRTWGEGENQAAMVAIGGGSMMEIFANGPDEPGQGAIRHFALATNDTDACAKACADAGYDVFIQPKDVMVGDLPARIAFVTGPVGEEVEFFQEK